jgi:hypothetical protein
MAVALVEHIGGACLDANRAADPGVVDVGVGDGQHARAVGVGIMDDMQLHAADAAVRPGPAAQLAERDGSRVDQPQQCRAFTAHLPVDLAGKKGEGPGKHGGGAAAVGIRQGRTRQRPAAQMIMVLAVGVPARFHAAQAAGAAELGVDQRHQMVPTLERLVVRIPVMLVHNPLKATPIDRFNQLAKDARCKAHAPSLSESRQPEGRRKNPVSRGMRLRHFDSQQTFPGQPCHKGERCPAGQ